MATLTMEQALGVVRAAGVRRGEIGSPSSIAIVDGGRELVAFARMDGALLSLSIEISQGKAYTARSMNMNTADIGPSNPARAAALRHREQPCATVDHLWWRATTERKWRNRRCCGSRRRHRGAG